MRVLFLIRQMEVGGAELQLALLAKGLVAAGHHAGVAVFYGGGALEPQLAASNIPVFPLHKAGRWDFSVFRRLKAVHDAFKPDVLHTYLPTSNKVGSLIRPFLKSTPVVWGIRAGFMDLGHYGIATRLSYRLEPWLSRAADAIIVNSESGQAHLARSGYFCGRLSVVPNGIDCERFAVDPGARARQRATWSVQESNFLIGIVGRLDPIKDHPTFLRAAALLAGRHPKVSFVSVGGGPTAYRAELVGLARALGLDSRIRWEGTSGQPESIYNALDAFALSSSGESFPNVVAEAMACGVPCAVTDVGDAARIAGKTGIVVAPRSPSLLADALHTLISMPASERTALGARARQRIVTEYSTDALVARTLAVLKAVSH